MQEKKHPIITHLLIFLRGLFMGIADVIPGVSGGTIAFITGIYPRLIHSLGTFNFSFILLLFKGKFTQSWKSIKKNDFALFIPLITGIGIAIFIISRLMVFLLETYSGTTFAFFFGLILASALFVLRKAGKLSLEKAIFVVLGFIGAYVLAGLSAISVNHSLPIIFVSGAVAICAMILPGISGAFILLLLNQYQYIIKALHTYQWTVIITFIIGAATGLIGFSKLVDYVLRKFKSLTLSFLVGVMLGSLRIPIEEISVAGTNWHVLVFGLLGFIIVFVLEGVFGRK
ncbi:DUF368 domain-containing protein [Candidatus Woesearchaeota archaeon]|mgnify:CR=1 FL=1|nr:DUF368 domain-containing protein [Candidatus Woesearchaeota archaeon]MBT5397142.1 DUF368 domain-containing protein [Candidatus Woesearchaeota archaeon]MBT5924480.1 DUF368 domain-containing protein [Candidatus Woesearchaeota archaeon]MBT6367312.1 DUF368 domain-containing protein [Candidatus Woesearchaeota archaeon]MBT7762542.1 DUF368 domain-containing protein [Candidatus Woesearchaeota archaeon]